VLGRRRGSRYGPDRWSGVIIDHGANLSESGAGQRKAYTDDTENVMPLRKVLSTLHTMGGTTKVLGEGNGRIPLGSWPDCMITDFDFRIVKEDSPMILGLPDITMVGWYINESACVLILREGTPTTDTYF
jgi:hypothetical protein